MNVRMKMRCEECLHEQWAHGVGEKFQNGETQYWWGSAYRWCDECDGFPHKISEPEVVSEDNQS